MKTKMVNWSIKLGLAGLATIATTLAIVGCDTQEVDNAEASVDSHIELYSETEVGYIRVYEVIDEETGVHYTILNRSNGGTAITPMYNADGTLKVG